MSFELIFNVPEYRKDQLKPLLGDIPWGNNGFSTLPD